MMDFSWRHLILAVPMISLMFGFNVALHLERLARYIIAAACAVMLVASVLLDCLFLVFPYGLLFVHNARRLYILERTYKWTHAKKVM